MTEPQPVAIVGAGPVGLAAAAELLERGLEPVVLERGPAAGFAVSQWGHVRLFSRWAELVAPAAERLLTAHGWRRPADDAYPTGDEWVRDYLRPLAEALGARVRCGIDVTAVARRGRDLGTDAGRAEEPLTVHLRTAGGNEELLTARGLIDASGTWAAPGPLGGDGVPAFGEPAAAEHSTYRCPDLSEPGVRARYAGRRIAVVGSGHSALTALVDLAALAEDAPGTHIDWVLRRDTAGDAFGGGTADQLPARGALGSRAERAVAAGHVRMVTGFRTESVRRGARGRFTLTATDGAVLDGVDEIVALTGFRPELSWLSELRLSLDSTLQAPIRLAPLIDPNVHSCGTVYPHGAAELSHPEPGVYSAGMKSYGRAPTFLALTGYEQVRSIAAALAGDEAAAARVELVLPETGVCSGGGSAEPGTTSEDPKPREPESEAASGETEPGGCCGPRAEAPPLTASPASAR